MNKKTNNALNGTKTEQNLRDSAAGEALAHLKYMIYSDIAHEEGNIEASKRFREHAGHEKEHAEIWLSYLDELSDTEENLDRMLRGESYENAELYPEYSRIAKEEGFYEISDKFAMTADAERHHADQLNKLTASMAKDTQHSDNPDTVWICTNCGYSTKGNMPPERCPLCGYPKQYFMEK